MKKCSQEEVIAFMSETKNLLNTSQKMEDIYNTMMERDPKAIASISFNDSGKLIKKTFEDKKNEVFKVASKLSKLLSFCGAGTIVGLKYKNSPLWPIFFWALLMVGHSPLLIDARLPKENTNNLLLQAKAKAIICADDEEFAVPSFRPNEVINEEEDYEFNPDWANHVVFCSSGTTGDAKMMVYSGSNLCAQIAESISMPESTIDIMYPEGICRNLAMLPFHHIFGFVAVYLWYSFYGKTIVYPTSLGTNDLLYACKKAKVTHLYSVPLFWDGLATHITRAIAMQSPSVNDIFAKMIAFNTRKITKKEAGVSSKKHIRRRFQKKLLGKHIRFAISGGGFLSPKTQNIINGLGYPLYNGFGMTEVGVSSVELSSSVRQRLKGSIGKPLYGVEYKLGGSIVTLESGEKSGELLVKSNAVHSREIIGGAYQRTLLDDGYFHTGDIALQDNQGNFFIKGRIKDTIILSNGENVFPDEIEYYFKDVHHLLNVVCLGAKLPGQSEEKIILVCEIDNAVNEEEIKKLYSDIKTINNTLPNEKKVQEILIDKRPFPMSASMKVKRFKIKEAIESGSDEFISEEGPKKQTISFEGYDKKQVEDVMKKVTAIFSKTLMLPEFKISPDAIWTNDLGGDSMSYIEMVGEINKAFNITIKEELYGALTNVNDFVKEIIDIQNKK